MVTIVLVLVIILSVLSPINLGEIYSDFYFLLCLYLEENYNLLTFHFRYAFGFLFSDSLFYDIQSKVLSAL